MSNRINSKTDYMWVMRALHEVRGNEAIDAELGAVPGQLTELRRIIQIKTNLPKYKEYEALQNFWFHMETTGDDSDLLRVSVHDDGKFDIVDFTTPARAGKVLHRCAEQDTVPQWVIEAISILRVADPRTPVEEVGFKVNDRVYYIVDRRNSNEQS